MFGSEIASLFVTFGANTKDFEDGCNKVSSNLEGLSHKTSGIFEGISKGFEMATGMGVFDLIGEGLARVRDSVIGMNAELEQSKTSWSVMLGGAKNANAELDALTKFSTITPFRFQDLDAAARSLFTFGGATLNTIDNLTLFGNAASFAKKPIQEVSFWSAEMFSKINAGQAFGHAALSLQQMGVISGDTAIKMEKMQKSGASSAEVWKVYTDALQKYNGMMAAQSTTLTGRLSTLNDVIDLTLAKVGKPIFDVVSSSAQGLIDILSGNAIEDFSNLVAGSLSDGLAYLGNLFQELSTYAGIFGSAMDAIGNDGNIVDKLANGFYALMNALGMKDSPLIDMVVSAQDEFSSLADDLGSAKDAVLKFVNDNLGPIKTFLSVLGGFIGMSTGVSLAFDLMAGAAVVAITAIFGALDGVAPEIWAIGAIVAGFVLAWQHDWGGIQEKVQALLPVLGRVAGFIGDTLGNAIFWVKSLDWPGMWQDVQNALGGVAMAIQPVISYVDNLVTNLEGVDFGAIFGQFRLALDTVATAFKPFLDWLKSVDWSGIFGTIANVLSQVWTSLKNFGSWLSEHFGPVWDWIKGKLSDFWTWLENVDWSGIWNSLTTAVGNAWTDLKAFWQWLGSVFGPIWDWIKQKLSDFWTWLSGIDWLGIWNGLTNAVGNVWQALTNFWQWLGNIFGPIWDWIKGKLSDFWTWLSGIDWAGIWNSLTTAVGNAWTGLTNFWQWLITTFGPVFSQIATAITNGAGIISSISWTNVWSGFTTALATIWTKVQQFVTFIDTINFGSAWNKLTADIFVLAIAIGNAVLSIPGMQKAMDALNTTVNALLAPFKSLATAILTGILFGNLATTSQINTGFNPALLSLVSLIAALKIGIDTMTAPFADLATAFMSLITDTQGWTNVLHFLLSAIGLNSTNLKVLGAILEVGTIAAIGMVTSAIQGMAVGFMTAIPVALGAVASLVSGISYAVASIELILTGYIILFKGLIDGDFMQATVRANGYFKAGVDSMIKAANDLNTGIVGLYSALGAFIVGFTQGYIAAIEGYWQGLFAAMLLNGTVTKLVDGMVSKFGLGYTAILLNAGLWAVAMLTGQGIFNDKLLALLDSLTNGMATKIAKLLSGVMTNAIIAGQSVIDGLVNAFSNGTGRLYNALLNSIKNALSSVTSYFGGNGGSSANETNSGKSESRKSSAMFAGGSSGQKQTNITVQVNLHNPMVIGRDGESTRTMAAALAPELSRIIKAGF